MNAETLILAIPDESMLAAVADYRQEMLDAGSDMAGCNSLRSTPDPEEWLKEARMLEDPETVPAGWVRGTQFMGMVNGELVGMIQVRYEIEKNEYLWKFGGHIGYSVRPSQRRKGYATQMLRKCLEFCRESGMKKVLITCDEDNEASRRTILACGGVYECTVQEPGEGETLERYWVTL